MKQKDARGRFLGTKKTPKKSAHTVCHEITTGLFWRFFFRTKLSQKWLEE